MKPADWPKFSIYKNTAIWAEIINVINGLVVFSFMTLKDRRQIRRENRIIAVLLVMLFVSLIILSVVFSDSFESGQNRTGDPGKAVIPTAADIGKTVYAEGTVTGFRKTYTGDHLIITLSFDDASVMPVFVPKSAGAADISGALEKGRRIGVSGTVREYENAPELVVKEKKDIVFLNG